MKNDFNNEIKKTSDLEDKLNKVESENIAVNSRIEQVNFNWLFY